MTPALTRRKVLATATAALLAPKLHAGSVPPPLARQWPETDFSRAAVPFAEILSGGVPRDGIPAITALAMRRVGTEARIEATEPVMTVEIAGTAPRAYPCAT